MITALANLARREGRRLNGRVRWTLRVGREAVMDAVHGSRQSAESVRDSGVNAWKRWFKQARRPIRRLSRRKRHFEEQRGFYRTEWGVERELEGLVGRDRLLILGPWFSEVGFETLYWIPFLHWVQAAFRIPADRMVAVSRGGVESWYRGLAGRYVEIWDDFDPAEFARRNAERGVTKQYELSGLDQDILDRVAARLGTREFDVIHPGLMYRLFTLYWSGQRPMGFVDAHTRWVRHQPPQLIDPSLLPRDYVAVKFYAARSLPDSPAMRDRLRAIVRTIAESSPVVLLDTGLVLEDDHADYTWSGDRDVVSARPWLTPQNNLGVQTQIVAGARSFVGTCGSIAWLAPRLGVDTAALYVDPKWLHAHLAVAMRAYHKLEGGGSFAPADLRGLEAILPRAGVRA